MVKVDQKDGLFCVKTLEYDCDADTQIELCFANIESLLKIALGDSDEHIKSLGGEQELLNLMNGYLDLAERLKAWKSVDCRKPMYKDVYSFVA